MPKTYRGIAQGVASIPAGGYYFTVNSVKQFSSLSIIRGCSYSEYLGQKEGGTSPTTRDLGGLRYHELMNYNE